MGDLYLYAAAAGLCVFLLIVPTITWIGTRAWYLGRVEDLTAQVQRKDADLKQADQIIAAAERNGFIVGDHGAREGRHAR